MGLKIGQKWISNCCWWCRAGAGAAAAAAAAAAARLPALLAKSSRLSHSCESVRLCELPSHAASPFPRAPGPCTGTYLQGHGCIQGRLRLVIGSALRGPARAHCSILHKDTLARLAFSTQWRLKMQKMQKRSIPHPCNSRHWALAVHFKISNCRPIRPPCAMPA
jgi:hypothetical protein